jgi:RNA polymerase sigma factor (sigma-70 family)
MVSPDDDINDFELVKRMADKDANPALARKAWGLFYVRHRPYMLRVSTKAHAELIGDDGVRDAVQDGFIRMYDGARNFDCLESCDPARQQRKVRAWLGRIIENVIRDRFRGQPQVTFVDAGDLEDFGNSTPDDNGEGVPQDERLRLVEAAFSHLSEEEQTVLRATMFWWRPDARQQRMPNLAMHRLTDQLSTTAANVRQIRSRAMKKLRNQISNNLAA